MVHLPITTITPTPTFYQCLYLDFTPFLPLTLCINLFAMGITLSPHTDRRIWVLGLLLSFIAINAFGGGVYGMMSPKELPSEWLEGSPFSSFFIPSLILFVVVGGSHSVATYWVLKRDSKAYKAALLAGSVLLMWILVQVAIIGFVSFLQPMMAGLAVVVFLMANNLKMT